jgi:Protein of unknown function (DUF1236)
MKNTLLITTAVVALVAGANLASAQRVDEPRAPAATTAPGKATGSKPITSAQGAGTKGSPKDDTQFPSKGAGPKTPEPERAQVPSKTGAPNATVQEESKPVVSKPLSPEQHAKIRDSLRGEKSEHLARDFTISVGAWVPRTIRLNAFPARFVESFPEYRDYEYIMVGDEILIVDPRTLQIIAVIPA